MTGSNDQSMPEVGADLVEYFVVVLPDAQSIGRVHGELTRAAKASAIRILDLVAMSVAADGTPEVLEAEALAELDVDLAVGTDHPVMLSTRDLELLSFSLRPGDITLVAVVEDRWAESLASTARALGGEVRAGERIARDRIQAAMDVINLRQEGGAGP